LRRFAVTAAECSAVAGAPVAICNTAQNCGRQPAYDGAQAKKLDSEALEKRIAQLESAFSELKNKQ
jgi:glutathione peroxidase-family protein